MVRGTMVMVVSTPCNNNTNNTPPTTHSNNTLPTPFPTHALQPHPPRASRGYYIVKPAASCQAQGIVVTRTPLTAVEKVMSQYEGGAVVQRYIAHPLLLDSY